MEGMTKLRVTLEVDVWPETLDALGAVDDWFALKSILADCEPDVRIVEVQS